MWRERAWLVGFYAMLLAVTGVLLAPLPPAGAEVEDIPGVDKLTHAVLFAGLALVAGRAYRDRPRWGIFAALVFYGGCIEIAQGRTGRTPELLDLLADAVGAAAVFLSPREPRGDRKR